MTTGGGGRGEKVEKSTLKHPLWLPCGDAEIYVVIQKTEANKGATGKRNRRRRGRGSAARWPGRRCS